MYNLVVTDNKDMGDPYANCIVFHDFELEELCEFVKGIEAKDSYYYEIIRQDEE